MSMAPVALVTGAAKRIGKAIVVQLHKQGFDIFLHYHHSRDSAELLAQELNALRPGSTVAYQANLGAGSVVGNSGVPQSLAERCTDLMDHCYRIFGRCDVLVNNASTYCPTPLLSGLTANSDAAAWEREVVDAFSSNALTPLFLVRAFARRIVERSGVDAGVDPAVEVHPCVVNLADAMVDQPLLNYCAYTMAKHALEGLVKAAALELAPVNIRVNAVAPGLCVMPPDMSVENQNAHRAKVPLGQREASVEDIAMAVAFLVSRDAKYITGSILKVDGGWSLMRN